MVNEIYEKYLKFANAYKLSKKDIKILWAMIKPICEHKEFQKRAQDPYWHHDDKTIVDHILCDTIVTYKIVKKFQNKNVNFINIKIAILIAMFHDLYEIPWQNTFQHKRFSNKHGFVHPIEAAINAITWYPEYFQDKKMAAVLIDGIVHHMYPLPVRVIDNSPLELNNQEKFDKLPKNFQEMIKASTNIGKFGKFSFHRSYFLEGRIMSKADKTVALKKDLHSIDGYVALISGHNKKLEDKKKKSSKE